MDIFQLFLNHLAERHHNNIYQNIQQDADYLEATMKEYELNEQYKKLNLSDEHQKVMTFYIDCISPLYTIAHVCDFKTEVEVVSHNGRFKPCWRNVNEGTY